MRFRDTRLWETVRGVMGWRFLVSLVALIALLIMGFDRWNFANQHELLAGEVRAARIERAEAAKERRQLIQSQRDVQARLDALVTWLTDEGIEVPATVLAGGRVVVRGSTDDDDDDSEGTGRQSGSKSGQPVPVVPDSPPSGDHKPTGPDRGNDKTNPGQGAGRARSDTRTGSRR